MKSCTYMKLLLCHIHVVTFSLISIQKGRGQTLLFSFENSLSPNLITKYVKVTTWIGHWCTYYKISKSLLSHSFTTIFLGLAWLDFWLANQGSLWTANCGGLVERKNFFFISTYYVVIPTSTVYSNSELVRIFMLLLEIHS